MRVYRILQLFVCVAILTFCVHAQETVFNVPSGDILDRSKVYGELDFGYMHSTGIASFTPRVVAGMGHRIEVGVNFNGLNNSDFPQLILSPTIKWKAYDGGKNGWSFMVGDNLFFPAYNKTYDAGNYVYAEFVKTWHSGTRATFGGYHFTADVVSSGQRAGGQFAFEQPINKRLTAAVDWYTGAQSLGYVTPGAVVKVTSKLTWYASYQIGNSGVSQGNHQFLTELGWNFN
ncbi:hypothetical protein Acid345_0513 [Candidatus Koribacter versatilis Ellin345]|uniref:Uncharacterized protein n=1 Tax=Koribacter versatilis (strain Ellin345) TaxID=204669 RepID=Q1IUD2_KORVE|nr:hypothetical protein [Candidatus Koribacter versatilis]ABF39518.1 hypothetical protein Acid345_0513 [Candidatus Koribacter versatilis Ellin345]